MTSVTLNPSVDTYHDTTNGTWNNGANPLWYGFIAGKGSSATYEMMMKWDVSSLPALLTVTNAYVELEVSGTVNAGAGSNMPVYQATSDWTGNSTPSDGSFFGNFSYNGLSSNTYYTVLPDSSTFRTLVHDWRTGAVANNGIHMPYAVTSADGYVNFFSTEDASAKPKLNIIYTTVPNAPTLNTVTNSATRPRVDVAWSAPVGGDAATGYKVDRALDSGFTTSLVTTDVGNTTSTTDTTTAFRTTYFYRVRGYNGTGDGTNSSTLSVTTPNPAGPIVPRLRGSFRGLQGR